jgi:hypothetical protein
MRTSSTRFVFDASCDSAREVVRASVHFIRFYCKPPRTSMYEGMRRINVSDATGRHAQHMLLVYTDSLIVNCTSSSCKFAFMQIAHANAYSRLFVHVYIQAQIAQLRVLRDRIRRADRVLLRRSAAKWILKRNP